MSDRTTTAALLERLHRHYIKPGPMPGGVFVPECGINGAVQTRADALYVGFTSTSGRLLVGHELKVSRADWRKELDTAGKADFWADNCHAWYIVAPSIEIVPPEELPHGWGLMIPSARTKTRMEVKVKAEVHADRTPTWKAVRSILARLDTLQTQQMHAFRDRVRDEERKTAEATVRSRDAQFDRKVMSPETHRRLSMLEQLENMLGGRLEWSHLDGIPPERAAAALRLVEARDVAVGRPQRHRVHEDYFRAAAAKMLAGLDEFTAALDDLNALGGAE